MKASDKTLLTVAVVTLGLLSLASAPSKAINQAVPAPNAVPRTPQTDNNSGGQGHPNSSAATLLSKKKCSNNRKCHPSHGCVSTPRGQCQELQEGVLLTPGGLGLLNFKGKQSKEEQPKFWRREPRGGVMGDEMACSWQPPVPDALPNFNTSDNTPEGHLKTFKHFSGSFFQKWYDWDAPIRYVKENISTRSSRDSDEQPNKSNNNDSNFQMRGGHEGPDKAYKLYNFCLKPGGRLSGYKPEMREYTGGSDLARFSSKLDAFYVNNWNKVATDVDPLDKEPTWYVDRKLMLLPYAKEHHPAHALMRTSAMILGIESAWPAGGVNHSTNYDRYEPDADPTVPARDDVTVVYVMLDDPKKSTAEGMFYPKSVLHPFTTLAARSHFGVFGTAKKLKARWKWTRGSLLEDREIDQALRQLLAQPICFKEGAILQSCYAPDCSRVNHDTASFPFFGFRQPSSQRLVARRLRACAGGLEARPTDGPLVLFGYRSTTRRFAFQNALVPALWAAIKKQWPGSSRDGTGAGRLTLVETNKYSLVQLIQIYTQVDIVFAPWSSSFLFHLPSATRSLLRAAQESREGVEDVPPIRGFIGIEVVARDLPPDTRLDRALTDQLNGLDRAPETDYGSMYRAAASPKFGVGPLSSQIKVVIPKVGGKYSSVDGISPLIPIGLLAPILEQADCLMRLEPARDTPSCTTGASQNLKNGFSAQCLEEKRIRCPEVNTTANLTRWRELREESASSTTELLHTLRTGQPSHGAPASSRIAKMVKKLSDLDGEATTKDEKVGTTDRLRISSALDALRDPFPRDSVQVLLVIACQAQDPTFGEYVNAELAAWRFFIANQNSILISFDKPCPHANLGLQAYKKERRETWGIIMECGVVGTSSKPSPECRGTASAPVVLVVSNVPITETSSYNTSGMPSPIFQCG